MKNYQFDVKNCQFDMNACLWVWYWKVPQFCHKFDMRAKIL